MSNNSYYKLEINGDCFGEDLSCLGEQLESIFQAIDEILPENLTWYLFDIFGGSNISLFELFPSDSCGIIKFSTTKELMKKVKHVVQFESGVFIASKNSDLAIDFENQPYSEAEIGFQLDNTLIEIRAFDFECFEFFLQNEMIYRHLQSKFF